MSISDHIHNRLPQLSAIAIAWILVALAWAVFPHPGAPAFEPADPAPFQASPVFKAQMVSRGETRETHAATVHSMPDGLMAFWFGGSREGAADVSVYQARYLNGAWGEARTIMGPDQLSQSLHRHVRKVGNPVSYRWPDGRLWLWFVSVSIGGWAGSSINLTESHDNGENWTDPVRLVTSPFLNISTLVRNPPVPHTDGTLALPVYHEFLGKFGEVLRISPDARILAKTRLTRGTYSLQPSITTVSGQDALALLRYAGTPPYRMLEMHSDDGGLTWSRAMSTSLPNPNSSVASFRFQDRVIAVVNDTEDGRHRLGLASKHEGHWQVFHYLESDPVESNTQYSYPSVTRDADGTVHILYTWRQSHIKHVLFNDAWLANRL